jgi:hypothetical protein
MATGCNQINAQDLTLAGRSITAKKKKKGKRLNEKINWLETKGKITLEACLGA